MTVPTPLEELVETIKATGEPKVLTVRQLLAWFHAQRRGRWVVSTIRSALREVGVTTEPDFETAYIDGSIVVQLDQPSVPPRAEGNRVAEESEAAADPVARIRMLKAANDPPTTVTADAPVAEAVTLMLMNGFSQLPVMSNERDVRGMVSWRSIGRHRARNDKCDFVRQCMETAREVPESMPLLDAIQVIVDHEVVLVRGPDRTIKGLVTTSDLSLQFRELAEPFLILAETENHLRRLLDERFTKEELATARRPGDDERTIESVADLTFGEYIRLLEKPANWAKLDFDLDRKTFLAQLDRVRRIRNDVMHFSPDQMDGGDLELLRDTVKFLQQIQ